MLCHQCINKLITKHVHIDLQNQKNCYNFTFKLLKRTFYIHYYHKSSESLSSFSSLTFGNYHLQMIKSSFPCRKMDSTHDFHSIYTNHEYRMWECLVLRLYFFSINQQRNQLADYVDYQHAKHSFLVLPSGFCSTPQCLFYCSSSIFIFSSQVSFKNVDHFHKFSVTSKTIFLFQ